MNYATNLVTREAIGQRSHIGYIQTFKSEARLAVQSCEPCLLESDIVVIVENIYAYDSFATLQQLLTNVHANKACSTCD